MAERINRKSRYAINATYYRAVYADRTLVREELLIGNRFVGAVQTVKTHRVKQGETLWMIAQRYYNDQSRWYSILDANPSVDPFALEADTELAIP